MIWAIFTGILIIPFLLWIPERWDKTINKTFFLWPLSLWIFFISEYYPQKENTLLKYEWTTLLPFDIAWNFDSLAFLFITLIVGLGTLIFSYAGGYMKPGKDSRRLFVFLSLFMVSMVGVVLSDHVIHLFLFWELTSISSFFLIGFHFRDKASRDSALTALAITGGGGLVMLAGLMGLGELAGTYYISEMIARSEIIVTSDSYLWIFLAIFFGAMTKSAQFPFHFWLPGAMKAPTPVSAYLHSATMVKAGVYLLIRFTPVLGGTDLWTYSLMTTGGITMVYAAFMSVTKTDLKGILAFSTVSALGLMIFLTGMSTQKAFAALALFILIHGLYKASLFLITGLIDHETGLRDITQLSGLRKVIWPVAAAGLMAAMSSGGVPPFLGFVGKDLIYEAGLNHFFSGTILTVILLSTHVLLFASGFLAGWKPFSGYLPEKFSILKLPYPSLWIPPMILAVLSLAGGIFPVVPQYLFVSDITEYMSGIPMTTPLKLWHGFNIVLGLSMITITVGLLVYFTVLKTNKNYKLETLLNVPGPQFILESLTMLLNSLSYQVSHALQNGRLNHYIRIIMVFVISLLTYKILQTDGFMIHPGKFLELTIYEVIIAILLVASVILAVLSRSRTVAVAYMGVAGLAICLIFVFYSAPDLAMTQFTIDTLTVILFVLVLFKLPKYIPFKWGWKHVVDGFLALSFGAIIVVLSLTVMEHQSDKEISQFYAENSYLLAKGKNIVNVILVDFRGADTMIEIVVLTIAAIGVFSLLKLYIHDKKELNE